MNDSDCEGPELVVDPCVIIDCRQCGFAHQMPLPDESSTAAFHEEVFFDELKPTYRDSHELDRAWWNEVHSARLGRIEAVLGRVGRLLDVGSGYGDLIAVANSRGWSAEGLEPSTSAAQWANDHGRPTYRGALSRDAMSDLGMFDAIVFDQSIEHIPHPKSAIETALGGLIPGGVLCVVFANDFSAVQQAAALKTVRKNWWVAPGEHVNYFSLQGMTDLLSQLRFAPVDIIGTFPIDLFLSLGFDYVGDPSLGRQLHERRMGLEMSFAQVGRSDDLMNAYRGLGRAGFGREIEVIAVEVGERAE